MKFPQHRRIGLRQPRVFSAVTAVICTVAMIAATFVVAPFAMADQDGGMRIEIDDSKSVGNWNISQKGQVVDLAVGQKCSSACGTIKAAASRSNSIPFSGISTASRLP